MFIAIKSKDDCSGALEAARQYSPNIEIVDEKTLVFDLTGSRAKDAPEIAKQLREKFASVAVSENLAAALLAVRWGQEEFRVQGSGFRVEEKQFHVSSSRFQVRKTHDDRNQTSSSKQTPNSEHETLNAQAPSVLSSLPIAALAQKADFLELMDSWAVHDLGSFARLPADEMVARFGPEIVEMQRQARGEAFRAVGWNVKEDKFFWAKDLEGAIETIEPLNFVLSKGVEQIFQNLDYVGLSTQSVRITLGGHEREKIYRFRLVFPTKNQKIWIRQIITKIELDTPGFNIERVEIEFSSTKPRIVQNNLYSGTILEPENLNLIVSKLKKVVGLEKIGLPKLRDSWSDAFYMTSALSPLIEEEKRGRGEVSSSKFQVGEKGSEFRVQGSGFRVQSSGFRVPGSEFRVRNAESEAKESSLSKQTLNSEPGTLNFPLTRTFYYLPQPISARVFFESGEPKALIIKGKREMVRNAGGPWRMDAEWYKPEEWRRDEWDIETETGAVYRVFTDKNGEAFVDGGYD